MKKILSRRKEYNRNPPPRYADFYRYRIKVFFGCFITDILVFFLLFPARLGHCILSCEIQNCIGHPKLAYFSSRIQSNLFKTSVWTNYLKIVLRNSTWKISVYLMMKVEQRGVTSLPLKAE